MTEEKARPDLMGWFFAVVFSLGLGVVWVFVFGEIFLNPDSTHDGSEKWSAADVWFLLLLLAPLVTMVLGRNRIGWLRRWLYKPVE